MSVHRNARPSRILAVVVVLLAALISTAAIEKLWAQNGAPLPFTDARIIIEVNSTDEDAGIQLFLDGEAWQSVTLIGPDGRKLLDLVSRGRLERLGLTELFFETQEPSFDEVPLEEFLARVPAGPYRVVGTTIEGKRIVGTAILTHNIPAGPVVLAPRDGAVVHPEDAVIVWLPVTRPRGIDIRGYQVIVEREDPRLLIFTVDLPATATSVRIPREFLESSAEEGLELKFEVLAIEAGGNQTITEGFFETPPRRR
jgi:hypothetical protein